jgi:transposase
VFAGRPRKQAHCPACGAQTCRVHDRARGWRRVLRSRSNIPEVALSLDEHSFRHQSLSPSQSPWSAPGGRCWPCSPTTVCGPLPHLAVVADPFHPIQDANRRVDEARRVEQEVHRRTIPS